MPPQSTMTLSFPPFTPWIKRIILANTAVFFLLLLFDAFFPEYKYVSPRQYLWLEPQAVMHGRVWELFTYGFLHQGFLHILFNMLSLWMFGSQLESNWGSRRFLEFYCICLVGAGLATVGVSYTGLLGIAPDETTVGASGAVYGILAAFAVLFGDREVFLFPLPVTIRARYVVWILIAAALYGSLQAAGGRGEAVAYAAHLGGALVGWIYVAFLPRRGLEFAVSEQYFGLRNRYHRWKRKQAAKKFEVYMREQGRQEFRADDYFDEHGNYRGPSDSDRGSGGGPRRVQ